MTMKRRDFLKSGGVGALIAGGVTTPAMADTAFTNFAFKAAGSVTNRTMPTRLAEEKNVLDYGADSSGTNDSTSAIQAAVDAAIAAGSGVYVPVGTYKVSDSGNGSAININTDADFSFYMRGAGGSASTIVANSGCSGYLINRSLGSPNNTIGPRSFENLAFINATTSPSNGGGLRFGSTVGLVVRNCRFSVAGIGLTTEDSAGNSSESVVIDTCEFTAGPATLASIGVVFGGSGSMTCCDLNGIGRASIIYGNGVSLNGNRCERCDTAFQLGVDAGGTDRGLHGFSIVAQEMEGVVNFIDFMGTVTAFTIGPVGMLGHDASNSGLAGFTENSQYGIRIRANTAYYGEIAVSGGSSFFDVGVIYVENYAGTGLGKRSFVTFTGCAPTVGGGSGVPWRIPAASAWPQFIACAGIDASTGPTTGTRYLYSGLPTGGDVLEGDEYDISDGNTGTIGANVTAGGGANRIHVRWNGTNWICLPG